MIYYNQDYILYHYIPGTPIATKDPHFNKSVESSIKTSYDTQNAVRNDLKNNTGNQPRGINRLSSKYFAKRDKNSIIYLLMFQWLLTFYRVRL